MTFRQTDPLYRRRPERPDRPPGGRGAEDPRILVLPAGDRRRPGARPRPGRHRHRAQHRLPGEPLRRVRSRRPGTPGPARRPGQPVTRRVRPPRGPVVGGRSPAGRARQRLGRRRRRTDHAACSSPVSTTPESSRSARSPIPTSGSGGGGTSPCPPDANCVMPAGPAPVYGYPTRDPAHPGRRRPARDRVPGRRQGLRPHDARRHRLDPTRLTTRPTLHGEPVRSHPGRRPAPSPRGSTGSPS